MRKFLVFVGVLVLVGGAWAASNTGPPAAGPTGTVKIDTPGMVVKIKYGKNPATKKPNEVPIPAGKEVPIPVGKYDVAGVQLFKQDGNRDLWCLNATTDLGKLKSLDVTEGQTISLQGGETLKIRTRLVTTIDKSPPKKATGTAQPPGSPPPSNKTVTVYIDYIGQAGEAYGPKALKGMAQTQVPPPGVRIRGEDDKILSEGQYRYGSGFGGFG